MSELIRRAIKEFWGPQCPDYDEDCFCCRAWKEYCDLAISGGWQPIETAPKDGTYFTGYWPHMSNVCAHHQGQYRTRWTEWGGGVWEADALGKPCEHPTHWQPLPLPPQKGCDA